MKLFISVILFSFLFISCGGYNEGILQKAEKGFIKFVGNSTSAMVSIDEGQEFSLDPKIEVYQVKPGRHGVKIFRDGQLILNRVVIIDNQTTMEIEIP